VYYRYQYGRPRFGPTWMTGRIYNLKITVPAQRRVWIDKIVWRWKTRARISWTPRSRGGRRTRSTRRRGPSRL